MILARVVVPSWPPGRTRAWKADAAGPQGRFRGGQGRGRLRGSPSTPSAPAIRDRVIAVSGSSARHGRGCKDVPVDTPSLASSDDVSLD